MTPLQADTAHLAGLAATPGWRDHVAHRINELEACRTGLWRGLREAVNAARKSLKVAESSNDQPKNGG